MNEKIDTGSLGEFHRTNERTNERIEYVTLRKRIEKETWLNIEGKLLSMEISSEYDSSHTNYFGCLKIKLTCNERIIRSTCTFLYWLYQFNVHICCEKAQK